MGKGCAGRQVVGGGWFSGPWGSAVSGCRAFLGAQGRWLWLECKSPVGRWSGCELWIGWFACEERAPGLFTISRSRLTGGRGGRPFRAHGPQGSKIRTERRKGRFLEPHRWLLSLPPTVVSATAPQAPCTPGLAFGAPGHSVLSPHLTQGQDCGRHQPAK